MSTKYEELKKEITEKVKASGGSRMSKSDLTQMTQTLLNTPEQEVKNYIKDSKEPITTKPVERYRESLKSVVKQFGVDSAELDKMKDVQFNKEHAEALNEVAAVVIKDYTSTGRKYIFPITEADESEMSIAQVEKAEKEVETSKIQQKEDGTYESVPTGKKKKTFKHKEMKVSNKIPAWLQEESTI